MFKCNILDVLLQSLPLLCSLAVTFLVPHESEPEPASDMADCTGRGSHPALEGSLGISAKQTRALLDASAFLLYNTICKVAQLVMHRQRAPPGVDLHQAAADQDVQVCHGI